MYINTDVALLLNFYRTDLRVE